MNEMNNQNFNAQIPQQQVPVQQAPVQTAAVQPEPVAVVSAPPVYTAPVAPEVKAKKKKSVLLIISIILNIVLILGIAAAAVFLYVLPALNGDGEEEAVVEEYSEYDFFVCDLTPLCDEDGKYGYINKKGEWVIKPQFEYSIAFGENGLAAASDGEKWGYINTEGEWAIEPKYDYAYTFYNGVAEVEKNVGDGYEYQYALINEKGEFIAKFGEYDYMYGFYGDDINYSKVEKDGKYAIIDKTGKEVVSLGEYDYIGQVYKDGFIFAEDKKMGFADFEGNYILEPKYDQLGYDNVYEWCKEDDCYEIQSHGEYCEEHAPLDEFPYCSYTGCYNRVEGSWTDYCWEHSEEEY